MAAFGADRNLLFGLLALQNDFISREDLLAAVGVWLTDKTRPLDEILLARQTLPPNQVELLRALVQVHLERHGNDPQQSLAALSSVGSVRDELRSLGGGELEASLSLLGDRRANDDPFATIAHSAGTSTSAGTRFHILRQHAKGGLGQVSVAYDDELHREVALKEIQAHHADNHDSRSRFVLEAEITGGLEHPGIVPVYGLGQYADGRPYYAMRFIRGDSLQEAVDRFHVGRTSSPSNVNRRTRSPSYDSIEFRKLLGRFIDVCNAIEYAHARGVLHRDLKPGNIMLGKYGETLVVDWGLAKVKGRDDVTKVEGETTLRPSSGSGSAPTEMGQAIGTPAYMPPEQAAGRLDELGPASDVYSLGATLYYVLTGRSPIESQDVGELLRKVQRGDFASPRSLKHDVPPMLNAICLRAMALRPQDRYASPQALADDVERFLADEPVTAHAEPVTVRARRWMRKHPKSVAALAASLLVGLTSSIVIAVVVTGKNEQLAVANADLKIANVAAREQSELAIKSLESVIFDIQRKLDDVPGAGDLQRSLLQTAIARLQEVSDQFAPRGAIDRNAAAALTDLGDVFLRIGSGNPEGADGPLAAARKLYQQAFDVSQQLAAADPRDAQAQRDLSVSYHKLGNVQLQSGQVTEALGFYQKSLTISQQLAAADPSDAQAQRDLSVSYDDIGNVRLQSGQVTEALGSYQKGLEIRQKLAAADPSDVVAQRDLSISYHKLGDVQLQSGQVTEALGFYQKGLGIGQQLAAANPRDAQAQRDLSLSYNNLGDVQLASGQVTEALGSYQKALEIRQKLAAADPSDAQAQRDLAISFERLGLIELQQGKLPEARAWFEKELLIAEQRMKADESNAEAKRFTSVVLNFLGDVQLQSGQVSEALASYRKDLELIQQLAAADPHDSQAQRDLSLSYNNLGDVQLASGQVTEALGSYQQGLEIRHKLAAADPSDAQAQFDLVVSFVKIGSAQPEQKQYERAIESFGSGLKVLQSLKERGRLAPANEEWIGIVEEAIEECRKLMEGALE